MAIPCALISGPLAFILSILSQFFAGWSVAGFFLTYFISGQAIFIVLLVYCHAAEKHRRRRHRGQMRGVLLDRPI
ncbi:hypothetical protein [Albidovulum sp.]|uniref:hypothetical protein n=1 Tax=Albidovulum sp. TaxID=1872424 RepID=UPI0039B8DD34